MSKKKPRHVGILILLGMFLFGYYYFVDLGARGSLRATAEPRTFTTAGLNQFSSEEFLEPLELHKPLEKQEPIEPKDPLEQQESTEQQEPLEQQASSEQRKDSQASPLGKDATNQLDDSQHSQKEEFQTEEQKQPAEQKEQEIINTGENSDRPNNPKAAYLTFDDGPTQYTGLIMDILAEYKAKATFFMLEPQMEKNTEILLRMKNEGHALALHGVTHNQKQFYQSTDSVLTEMITAQAKLSELTGVKSFLMRTPYGSKPYMTPEYMDAAQKVGFKIWDWNVDSMD